MTDPTYPNPLDPWAVDYYFALEGFLDRPIHVTRYDNHYGLRKNWSVMWVAGGMNPWYLSGDGWWRYKSGSSWTTPQQAYAALRKFEFHNVDSVETPAPRGKKIT